MCSVWLGGGVSTFIPVPHLRLGVCPLCLCFASRLYLRSIDVRLGVLLRVMVSSRGSVLCLALPVGGPFFLGGACLVACGFGSITYLALLQLLGYCHTLPVSPVESVCKA